MNHVLLLSLLPVLLVVAFALAVSFVEVPQAVTLWAALRRAARGLRRTLIYDELADVRDFARKFDMLEFREPGHVSRRVLNEYVEHLREELDELQSACERQDLAEQVDALVDLVWIAKKLALGLGVPWHLHWLEVRRANDERVLGVSKRGHQHDVVKPLGWVPPDHAALLTVCGYDEELWKGPPLPCAACRGEGRYPDTNQVCHACHGNGTTGYLPYCLPGVARSYPGTEMSS